MSKTLVVGCDGTWNTRASETNIHWLTHEAVQDDRQIVFYGEGVGTAGDFDAKYGGNFGIGLSRNVREAYAFVLDHYEPGDDLFVFGFSRGAFTARSLCGFMRLVGRLGSADDIDDAYFYYRIHEPGEDDNFYERWFRPTSKGPIAVRFLGVFDTVGALGLPFAIGDRVPDASDSRWGHVGDRVRGWLGSLGDRARRPIKGFHDTALGDNVEEARHAVAIDECRGFFVPTMWTGAPGTARKLGESGTGFVVRQTVEQVWFAGSHVDIGGGDTETPREQRLSNLALLWMAEKAQAAGMRFQAGFLDQLRQWAPALAGAAQHDPMTAEWERTHRKLGIRATARPIGNAARRAADPNGRAWPLVSTPEAIHHSVRARMGRPINVKTEADPRNEAVYAPPNVVPGMIQPAPGFGRG